MTIIYIGSMSAVVVPGQGEYRRGIAAEIGDDIGERLCRHNPHSWQGALKGSRDVPAEAKVKLSRSPGRRERR